MGEEIFSRLELGKIFAVQKKYTEAFAEYSLGEKLSWKVYNRNFNPVPIVADYYAGIAKINQGDYDGAKSKAAHIQQVIQEQKLNYVYLDYYYLLLGEIDIAQKHGNAALNVIEKSSGVSKSFSPYYWRLKAAALALTGNFKESIKIYKRFYNDIYLLRYITEGYFYFFLSRALADYNIAKIYERMGDSQKAREHYTNFLDLWINSDSGIAEIEDAKKQLAVLNTSVK